MHPVKSRRTKLSFIFLPEVSLTSRDMPSSAVFLVTMFWMELRSSEPRSCRYKHHCIMRAIPGSFCENFLLPSWFSVPLPGVIQGEDPSISSLKLTVIASEPRHDKVIACLLVPSRAHQLVWELAKDLRLLRPGQLLWGVPEPSQSLRWQRGSLCFERHCRIFGNQKWIKNRFLEELESDLVIFYRRVLRGTVWCEFYPGV